METTAGPTGMQVVSVVTHAGEGLAEGPVGEVHLATQAVMVRGALAGGAQRAEPTGLVDRPACVVLANDERESV
ncbi:MAG: hypothetical protein O2992_01225 [Gemmatimonadetes bacterium]|nr:hypothetical protein [Gemmatimonadota bacterium]